VPRWPLVNHPLDPAVRRLPLAVVPDLERHAGVTRRLVDAPDLRDRQGERLLDEDMLPGSGHPDRDVRVRGVWGRDQHAVDLRVIEHRVEVVHRAAAMRRRESGTGVGRARVARDQDRDT
jgi:hypothetical protein